MTSGATLKSVNARLAEELAVGERQVAAAVHLLDEGSTVPFIARYRKEVTGSLDDGQLRTLEELRGAQLVVQLLCDFGVGGSLSHCSAQPVFGLTKLRR